MISCKQCQTPNSLDSTFCKRCGAPFAETDLVEAQARLEKLVEEGNALFNQGRTEEALAIADSVVLSNPSSVSGWSLKTLCHQRRGEIAEALECADRLVELNPDSDFDKIRRSSLRQKLQTDLQPAAAPDRRLAFVGAISAVVLVLCTGAIVARVNANNAAAAARASQMASNSNLPVNPVGGLQAPPSNYSAPVTSQGNSNPNSAPPPTNAGTQNPGVSAYNDRRDQNDGGASRLGGYSGQELPNVGSGLGNTSIEPLSPGVELGGPMPLTSTSPKLPQQGGAAPDRGDPPPMPVPDQGSRAATEPKGEDPGSIEIVVHRSGPKPGTGGSEPMESTGLDSLMRVGGQQYQLGNYAGAAKSYEQAIQSGGDAIVLNRRLGQAYQNLGRTSDAAEAFRRCITAVDAALASGKGDKERLTSTRGVCEQSLKVLQGG